MQLPGKIELHESYDYPIKSYAPPRGACFAVQQERVSGDIVGACAFLPLRLSFFNPCLVERKKWMSFCFHPKVGGACIRLLVQDEDF